MREIIRNNQEAKKTGPLDPGLMNYVAQCRKMRIADEEVRKRLLKVGWAEEEADRVLGKAKTEANTSFLSPRAKPVSIENIYSNESSEENVKNEFSQEKKSSGFFSKKKIIMIIALILFFAGSFFVVYYLIFRKNNPVFRNKEASVQNSKEIAETDCSAKKFKKPERTGSAVFRVDSTMKLLLNAINEGNYCLAISLFSDDSKDKHKDLIKKVIENEAKRAKFAQDLSDYMIPQIDENVPSSEAKATVNSTESGSKQFYSIIFLKEETGEYLISSM